MSETRFARWLEDYQAARRRKVELEVEAFDADEIAREERRARTMDPVLGFAFFRATYFPHLHFAPDSALHERLEMRLPEITAQPGTREVVIAGRGSAKTGVCTVEFTLWCIVTKLMKFIVIASDTTNQAVRNLSDIALEAEFNIRLRSDFPEIHPTALWNKDERKFAGGTKVMAFGSGKAVRGLRDGGVRPGLVILDDIENDENVASPQQREKTEDWIDKAIMKLGPADGSMRVIYVGTVLHHDAVIARKAKSPSWTVTRYDALRRWPDRMDLWDEFADIVRAGDEPAARAFYFDSRAAMDQGAVVTWPEVQPLAGLMLEWARDPNAFMSERQNEPVSANSPFQNISLWSQLPSEGLVYFGAIDPSLGKHGKQRDPSAIIVGAYDMSKPALFVVEALIRKRLPDTIISDVIHLQRVYGCLLWFVESVQFQEFLQTEIMRRAALEGVSLPTIGIKPVADKALRIERIQPPMASGMIKVHASQTTLLQQLRQWPNADHDDGPDALEMLYTNAVEHGGAGLLKEAHIVPRAAHTLGPGTSLADDPFRMLNTGGAGGGGSLDGFRML